MVTDEELHLVDRCAKDTLAVVRELLELRAERGAIIREAHDNKQRARAFERDAERYRKVRRGQHWSVIDGIGNPLRGEVLDAAVDAVPAVG